MCFKDEYLKGLNYTKEKKFNEAFIVYKNLADNKYIDAYPDLGICYLNGLGTNINYDLAFKYFSLAAIEKRKEAYYYLAVCYINGYGVNINLTQGELWLKNAINENVYKAYYDLGKIYINSNKELALKYFKEGASFNEKRCTFAVVNNSSDNKTKKDYLIKAINIGSIKAVYELGLIYLEEGNKAFAEFFLKYAANHGITDAYLILGRYMLFGDKLFLEPKQGYEYLLKASSNNIIEANIYLGDCYYYGIGVDVNLLKAKYYYELAANNNNLSAINKLAEFYFDIHNELYDEYIGKYYTILAASLGDVLSMRKLGYFYLHKIGTEQVDIDKAYSCFSEAAKHGDKVSKNELLKFKKNILGRLKYD